MADDDNEDTYLDRPNRRKASSKATKTIVAFLLVVSAVIILIITLGGWDTLEGAKALQIAYILIYLLMAFLVMRWNRGVLPLAAALAIVLLIFAAVSGPAWFDRDKAGLTSPALDESILGLLCLILVPIQILLIAFAMRGFQQAWNVEVERSSEERRDEDGGGRRGQSAPAPACAAVPFPSPARVVEWQTLRSQKPLLERACGFESRPGHAAAPWREARTRDRRRRPRARARAGPVPAPPPPSRRLVREGALPRAEQHRLAQGRRPRRASLAVVVARGAHRQRAARARGRPTAGSGADRRRGRGFRPGRRGARGVGRERRAPRHGPPRRRARGRPGRPAAGVGGLRRATRLGAPRARGGGPPAVGVRPAWARRCSREEAAAGRRKPRACSTSSSSSPPSAR